MMINEYYRINCLKEVLLQFDEMKKRGMMPLVITYAVLLNGSAKDKFVERNS